jgi:hypothetical protein
LTVADDEPAEVTQPRQVSVGIFDRFHPSGSRRPLFRLKRSLEILDPKRRRHVRAHAHRLERFGHLVGHRRHDLLGDLPAGVHLAISGQQRRTRTGQPDAIAGRGDV